MPIFPFRCMSCDLPVEIERPIGQAPNIVRCVHCGGTAKQVLGVGLMIGAGALPNKRAGVLVTEGKDSALDQDMGAYKRMRDRGLQPQHIDGSAKLEDKVADNFDINYGKFYGRAKTREEARERIRSGLDEAQQIAAETGNDWLKKNSTPAA